MTAPIEEEHYLGLLVGGADDPIILLTVTTTLHFQISHRPPSHSLRLLPFMVLIRRHHRHHPLEDDFHEEDDDEEEEETILETHQRNLMLGLAVVRTGLLYISLHRIVMARLIHSFCRIMD